MLSMLWRYPDDKWCNRADYSDDGNGSNQQRRRGWSGGTAVEGQLLCGVLWLIQRIDLLDWV